MNQSELNSFKLSDAVAFHDRLNPKLFNGQHLKSDAENQLKIIAQDFLEEMGINDLDVTDITVSGSNAAYSYTKHSDLDLHILVDMSKLPNDEVYKELFDAKKTVYNADHTITLHGIPIELYVQDANQPVTSIGEYSVLHNKWLKLPNKRRANLDQTATRSKYEKLLSLIEYALKEKDLSTLLKLIKSIHRYRQAGLDKGGEFGPENLAYKALRSQGYITKLYDLRDKLHSEKLSFETMYQNIDEEGYGNHPSQRVDPRTGKKYVPPKSPLGQGVAEAFDTPLPITWEKGMHGDVDALAKLPDGSNLSIMFNKQDNIKPDDKTWMVEFYRNNSQEVTGEGDAQKVFSTVLVAIQQFIKKYKPLKIYFSASKLLDPSINYGPDDVVPNPESRAKLYDRLVQRYAKAWGYRAFRGDTHASVMYELSRIPKQKDVNEASGYIPSEKEKNDPRFKTGLTVDIHPDSIKKNAKAFYWNTSRAGIPPTAKANGKI